MWTLITDDYEQLKEDGSIVVFHDKQVAEKKQKELEEYGIHMRVADCLPWGEV